MPTYEFICDRCVKPFERRLSIMQTGEETACPGCGSLKTRRLLSSSFNILVPGHSVPSGCAQPKSCQADSGGCGCC